MKRSRTAKVGLEDNLPCNMQVQRNGEVAIRLSDRKHIITTDSTPSSDIFPVSLQNNDILVEVISTSATANNRNLPCETTSESSNETLSQAPFKESLVTCERETQTEWNHETKMDKGKDNLCLPPRRHSTGNMHRKMSFKQLNACGWQAPECNQQSSQNTSQSPMVLEQFLAFLYYVGMSPTAPTSSKALPTCCNFLQNICFTLFAIMSALQAIGEVKDNWIIFNAKEDLVSFIGFGFLTASCLSRLYNIYILTTSETQTLKLLSKISDVDSLLGNDKSKSAHLLAICIVAASMVLVAINTIFGNVKLSEWTVEDLVLDRSFELSETLFIWSSENLTTQEDLLFDAFGADLTWSTGLLGALNTVLIYCGSLHGCVLLDLWPVLSLQICVLQSHFNKIMEKQSEQNSRGQATCPLSIHWEQYMELRGVCDQSDLVFGKQLKFIHMQNILLFGYYLLKLLNKDSLTAEFLVDTFSVIKVAVTYYLVQHAAEKNGEYEDCVINCSEQSATMKIGGKQRNVSVLMKNMKRHPIGIGRGEFFVNQAFLMKLICTVGSIFMLLSGQKKESAKEGTI